jgi:hypothetical protein
MDFGHKHYVPILKTKGGERWALSYLKSQTIEHVSPLLEFHPHKTKPLATHLEETCEGLEAAWGNEREVFLDTLWLHLGKKTNLSQKETGDATTIKSSLDCARTHIKAVPVVRLSYGKASRKEIRSAIEEDGRGFLLRIRPSELAHEGRVEEVLNDLGVTPNTGHLLLDYRGLPMNLESDVPKIPYLKQWRTFSSAAGVFPRSLTGLSLNKWYKIPREDWEGWNSAVVGKLLSRKPAFADYTTRDHGAPADGGSPSVNLRYTRANNWLVRIGGKVKDGASAQMKQVCKSLIAMKSEFDGPNYSAGDNEIYKTAQPDTGPGNPGQWVKWGISHHIVLTAAAVGANT